ncbi:MAG: hypothetical protein MZV70_45470 [Desulfobacterales bacterium]|nr:hypothetical protein [Desulfobacterales bacterium]
MASCRVERVPQHDADPTAREAALIKKNAATTKCVATERGLDATAIPSAPIARNRSERGFRDKPARRSCRLPGRALAQCAFRRFSAAPTALTAKIERRARAEETQGARRCGCGREGLMRRSCPAPITGRPSTPDARRQEGPAHGGFRRVVSVGGGRPRHRRMARGARPRRRGDPGARVRRGTGARTAEIRACPLEPTLRGVAARRRIRCRLRPGPSGSSAPRRSVAIRRWTARATPEDTNAPRGQLREGVRE